MTTQEQKNVPKTLAIESTFLFRDQLYFIFSKFPMSCFLLVALCLNLYTKVTIGYWNPISKTLILFMIYVGFLLTVNSIYDLLRKKWVFCRHTYLITPEEFRETTDVNDTPYKWSQINAVYKGWYGIFISAKSSAVFIHKRDFQSDDEFNEAFSLIHTYWEEGKKPPKHG